MSGESDIWFVRKVLAGGGSTYIGACTPVPPKAHMFAANASLWHWLSIDVAMYALVLESNGWRFFTWPWPGSRRRWSDYLKAVITDEPWANLLLMANAHGYIGNIRFDRGNVLLSLYKPHHTAVYPNIVDGRIAWGNPPPISRTPR